MKTHTIIVIIILSMNLFSVWHPIEENKDKEMFEVNNANNTSTEIQFNLDGFEEESVEQDDRIFSKISYWNEGEFTDVGKPKLPRFSRLLAIPNFGEVSVEILSSDFEIIENIDVYPVQPFQSESEKNSEKFMIDDHYYQSGSIYPKNIIEKQEPAILRDYRVVSITINPFRYDPLNEQLIILKNVEFKIIVEGNGGSNTKIRSSKRSRFFEKLYVSSILNYEEMNQCDLEYQTPSYLFIYADDTQIESDLQYLIDWKHRKGFEVHAVSTAETGTSLPQIIGFIQNAYDNWENPPEFVCLVGDAASTFFIPTGYMDGGPGDHIYTLPEGNDDSVNNGWVTLIKEDDELFSTGFTDENGNINLPVEMNSFGEMMLTVTKHNFIPELELITIIETDIYVNVEDYLIDDDNQNESSGNNDGQINPGEEIELGLSLKNHGEQTAFSIKVTISTESEFVTISDNFEEYGNMGSGEQMYSSDDFGLIIHPDVFGGYEICLNIVILDNSGNSWTDMLYLYVEGVILSEAWEVVYVDFSFAPITINNSPENLTIDQNYTEIVLNWDLPESSGSRQFEDIQQKDVSNSKKKVNTSDKRSYNTQNDLQRSLNGYNIYRNDILIDHVIGMYSTSYIDADFSPGEYSYYVTALYDEGESGPSNVVLYDFQLPMPTNLIATITPNNLHILLSWQPPDPIREVTGYRVYCNDEFLAELNVYSYLHINAPEGTLVYGVSALYGEEESQPIEITVEHYSGVDNPSVNLKTTLLGNHPNPFNPDTQIKFSLKNKEEIILEIFNIKGEKIITLLDGEQLDKGYHNVYWDGYDHYGNPVPSGIYFYRMITNNYTAVNKMILMK